ncbi:MAG TPA: type II secretion system F family protein [Candidatus Acidoferrales bacterium]|nr:type II secretion system F family protein [Candidatus Acidoferrales bacterium]
MLWVVTSITFIITVVVAVGLFIALTPKEKQVADRLSRLMEPEVPVNEAENFSQKQKERVRDSLASLGKMLPAAAGQQASRSQLQMVRAGFRGPDAMLVLRGAKVLLPLLLMGLVFFTGVYKYSPLFILLAAAGIGFIFPDMWLSWRISARQQRLRLALPDGLDLLVICVEVGLGMDQAILRVAEELRIVHPELSDEFKIVNLEMRVGKTRIEALRELARRTGLEDLKTLVAMLIQTERFGTSIAQSLRVHSDELRTKRRQRAEELSAKTTVKMVGPLVFFIFPALMVVLVGPAVISMIRQLLPALK